MSRILIAVPTYENIYPDTFRSIYRLEKGDSEVDFDFFRGYDAANARNRIAEATLEKDYDYAMMIDSDMVVPEDALTNLLQTQQECPLEHTVAVGYCLARPKGSENRSGRTTAFKFGGKNYATEDAYTGEELKSLRDSGVCRVQVRGSGLACALIHREVFERMTYPYFKWTEYRNKGRLSEDLYFCEQLKVIKKPVYVDTRVACGHMMRYVEFV